MSGLAAAVDALLAVDVKVLDETAAMERLLEVERELRRLSAVKLRLLERVDRSGAAAAGHGSTAAWLRTVTGCGPVSASRQVHLARDLADVLPNCAASLAEGEISVAHAQVAAGLRRDAADEDVRRADPALAAAAARMSPEELRGWVTAARHSLQPERVAIDERKAWEDRELHAATTFRGIGVGNWTLDPVSQERVMTAVHAASPPLSGEDRTARQRRADGLVTIAEFFLRHAMGSAGQGEDVAGGDRIVARSHGGQPPQLSVLVGWATLSGEPGQTGTPAGRTGFGQSISGEAARRLACDAGITRIITGPASEILDVGRASRTFTLAARRGIIARDRHCRWPGCTAPAAWCEAHHAFHWAYGGPSDLDNGVLLCGRHHDRVHHHKHAVITGPDGGRTIDLRPGSADEQSESRPRRDPPRGASGRGDLPRAHRPAGELQRAGP